MPSCGAREGGAKLPCTRESAGLTSSGRSLSSRREVSQAIRDRDVLLVDDVLTTGATAGSAAEALGSGGARSVVVLTFARALPA